MRRLMITVQATKNNFERIPKCGVSVYVVDIPDDIYTHPNYDVLADFIAKVAGEVRKRFRPEFGPEVAVQIIP